MNWHAKSEDEILKILNTSTAGLSDEERGERLKKYGPNDIKREKKLRFLKLVWGQLKSPLVFILIIAGIIALILREFTDALVVLIAVLINTAIGVFQEGKASRAFEKIRESLKHDAAVYINGEERKIDALGLVPGDVITLRTGDQVPADSRIILAKGLEINEAALTGEWLPVPKDTETLNEKTPFLKRTNLAYLGTFVSEGWALAVVTETGKKTELGKIAAELAQSREPATPFQQGVKKLSHLIGLVVVLGTFAIFLAGLARGEELEVLFFMAVAIAVAAVPEGLPVAVTVVLALGMEKILKAGALVKKLIASETLGSTTVLLTDKTGTLTKGEMQIAGVLTAEDILINKKGNSLSLAKELPASHLEALAIGMYTADVVAENVGKSLAELKLSGRPTDKALFQGALEAGLNPKDLLQKHPRLDFIPFDSERRFAASLHKSGANSQLFISGAPETLLERSSFFNGTPEVRKFAPGEKNAIERAAETFGREGARVIGVAFKNVELKELPHEPDHVFQNLVFVGLIAFRDPLRSDAKETLQTARKANLHVVMLTGDHRNTAERIAAEAGLSPVNVMEGEELEAITPEGLKKRIEDITVFARVLPHQKQKLVDVWRDKDAIIAMTGDGVNDAPALKRADIGIALGSGTDVAKEAADIVLLDDNLKVIIKAIEEGRVIFDNIRKIVTYLLSTGFTELILIGGSFAFGLPLPVLPIQILWANLVQEGFMNFAFAFEPKEKDIILRDPKKSNSRKLFNREMAVIIFGIGIITDLILFAVFLFLLKGNYDFRQIQTLMFVGLSLNAIFFAFALKSLRQPIWKINIFSNPYLLGALALSLALLIGAVTLEPLRSLLKLAPLTAGEFAILLGLGMLDLILIEFAKLYFIVKREL